MKRPDNKWEWVGSIETANGLYADLLNLQPEQVHVDDIATSLSHICRFNGHLPSFYSVAEHSVRVAWWLRDNGQSPDIVLTGLLHDAAEAYVGDLMRPLKRIPEMEAVFKPIEERVMEVIHTVLGGNFPHPEVIHQADYAVYTWEVENIRTGKATGLSPDIAKTLFLDTLHDLSRDYIVDTLSLLIGNAPEEHNTENPSRTSFLMEVASLVDGDRNAQYGDPVDDFRRTAIYWNTHLGGVYRRKAHALGIPLDEEVLYILDNLFDPHDVAIMMGQLKHSRLAWDPYKKDTWLDMSGYAACGYDCVIRH